MSRDHPGLDVDGPRPAVAWVLTLPATWTTAKQRLILLCIALDSFRQRPPFVASPSLTTLQARMGETTRRALTRDLDALAEPVEGRSSRPALLEVVTVGKGTRSSTYRLCVEVGPDSPWLGTNPHHYDPASSGAPPTTTADIHRPEHDPADEHPASGGPSPTTSGPSGGPSGGPSSGASPTTPFPFPSSTYPPTSGTGRARPDPGEDGPPTDDELTTALRGIAARTGVRADTPQLAKVIGPLIDAGWTAEQLTARAAAEDLAGARAPGPLLASRLAQLGSPPYRRPPWCGTCDERTRMREDDDGRPSRCPRCHPQEVSAA